MTLAWALFCLQMAHAGLPIQHWTQPNGARVWLVESPAIPMVDVQIDFDAGGRRDPAQQAGLAAVMAGMLSKGVGARGTDAALDENQLGEAWADLGASFGAGAGGDRMSLSLRSLTEPDLLERAVALAARQIAEPSFPDAVWVRERGTTPCGEKPLDWLLLTNHAVDTAEDALLVVRGYSQRWRIEEDGVAVAGALGDEAAEEARLAAGAPQLARLAAEVAHRAGRAGAAEVSPLALAAAAGLGRGGVKRRVAHAGREALAGREHAVEDRGPPRLEAQRHGGGEPGWRRSASSPGCERARSAAPAKPSTCHRSWGPMTPSGSNVTGGPAASVRHTTGPSGADTVTT